MPARSTPLASGLLPIALGEATKTVPFVMDGAQGLPVHRRLGHRRPTPTTPRAGSIATSDKRPDEAAIAALLPRFTGTILQVPPKLLGDQDRRRARR